MTYSPMCSLGGKQPEDSTRASTFSFFLSVCAKFSLIKTYAMGKIVEEFTQIVKKCLLCPYFTGAVFKNY